MPWNETTGLTPTGDSAAPQSGWLARTGASAPRKSKPKQMPVHSLGDLLDWQRAQSQEHFFRRGSSDANRAALRNRIGLDDPNSFLNRALNYGAPGATYANAPHWQQGVVDVAIDTLSDPLTYETLGLSRIATPLLKGGEHLLRAVAPAIPKGAKELGGAVSRVVQDATRFGSRAIRAHGQDATDRAIALEARQASRQSVLHRRLSAADNKIMAGLTDAEKTQVQQIMHGELDASHVAPHVRDAAQARARLSRAVYALKADRGGRARVGQWGSGAPGVVRKTIDLRPRPAPQSLDDFVADLRNESADFLRSKSAPTAGNLLEDLGIPISSSRSQKVFGVVRPAERVKKALRVTAQTPFKPLTLPNELQEFARAPGEYSHRQFRRNYFPGPHDAAEVAAGRPAREFNILDALDPHSLQQDEFHIDPADVNKMEDAYRGMLTSSARTTTANELRQSLSKIYSGSVPHEIHELFTRKIPATGSERSDGQRIADAWRAILNLPKTGVVGTSPRHMANIANLLAVHAPHLLPQTVATFGKLAKIKDPLEREAFLAEAINMGLDAPFEDKREVVAGFLRNFGLPGKAVAAGMQKMNKATWDFDTAAALTLAKDLAQREGVDALVAGQRARRALVDYRHTSPLTNWLKNVLPFATFESQVPAATLKGVARNPARAEAVNRATRGLFLGGDAAQNDGKKPARYSGPTAKVGRAVLDPAGFARDASSDAVTGPLELLLARADKQHWLTHGKPVDWHFGLNAASSPIPFGRDLIQQLGLGRYPKEDIWRTLLRSSSGLNIPGAP